MFEGVIIFVLGIVVGYYIRPFLFSNDLKQTLTKIITNQKGIVVDLMPPVDLGEIPHDEKTQEI
jgi:hypothetical protein